MLERRENNKDEISDEQMGEFFNKHPSKIMEWMNGGIVMDIRYINYNEILENPVGQTIILNQFLNHKLSARKAVNAMDKSLYRNR